MSTQQPSRQLLPLDVLRGPRMVVMSGSCMHAPLADFDFSQLSAEELRSVRERVRTALQRRTSARHAPQYEMHELLRPEIPGGPTSETAPRACPHGGLIND